MLTAAVHATKRKEISMRKFLLAGIVAIFLPLYCHANPLDVPTGGNWITPPTAATVNGYFVGKSTTSVKLTTPTASYQYCITHVAVTAPSAGVFEMWWSTSAITAGTTDYVVQLAANSLYDTTWANRTPYCSPPDNLLNIFLGVSGSTVTYEGYTYKGGNP